MRFLKGLLAVLFALCSVKGQSNKTSLPYSSLHLLTAELGIQQLPKTEWSRLQSRLQILIGMAFQQATLLRLGASHSSLLQSQGPNSPSPFTVQILSAEERLEGGTQIDFLVLLQGSPVLAQVVAEDLSLMTLSHFSAILQYPVLYIGSKYQKQVVEGSRWWIIAILIGSGFIIALCGWALLFLYYNTCGRPVVVKQTEDNKFTGDVTKKLEANANVVDDGLWTTVIPRPHSPVMGQHEKEMESTR
uniref:Uncharacterized protein n=1 Tax=Ditylenchus dipsaci TaxID=166011 RepID=A0A915EQS9_9BILA